MNSDPNLEPSHQLIEYPQPESAAGRIAKFLNRVAANELNRHQQKDYFPYPFHLTENTLRDLERIISTHISRGLPSTEPDFSAEIRFANLQSIRLDKFAMVIDDSGNSSTNPESVVLHWTKISIDVKGDVLASDVNLRFVTEQKFLHDKGPSIQEAFIELAVSGSDSNWVDRAFRDIWPVIEECRLEIYYRPLTAFSRQWFVSFISYAFAIFTYSFVYDKITNLLYTRYDVMQQRELSDIVSSSHIDEKINLLAKAVLQPHELYFWPGLALGGIVGIATYWLGTQLLPKMAPRSFIAIGRAKKRAIDYYNGVRMFLYGGIVAIVISVMSAFVADALKKIIFGA